MSRKFQLAGCGVLLGLGGLIAGCDPPPPEPQELGRLVFRESEVPGADKPYVLPEYLRNLQPEETPDGPRPGE